MNKNIFFLLFSAFFQGVGKQDWYPSNESSASVDMVFSSEKVLQTYSYSFYNVLPSRSEAFKHNTTLDYGVKNSLGGMEVGAYTVNSATSWSWTALRNINLFLENNTDQKLSETVRNNYSGIAYPIPEVVIQLNPNLTQNPGW